MSDASQAQLCALQENLSIRKLQIDSPPSRPLSACFPFMGLDEVSTVAPIFNNYLHRNQVRPDTHECFRRCPRLL
jgi:hypothetical protein